MSACPNWQEQLLDCSLGSPPVRELEDHLQRCPACAAALAELRTRRLQLDAGLAALVGQSAPPPAFRARVLAAAEAAPGGATWQPAWRGVLAAMAVLLLAGALLFSLPGRWATPEQPPAPPSLSLSHWRSPTEALLRTPGEELLKALPRMGESYFPLQSESSRRDESKGGNDES